MHFCALWRPIRPDSWAKQRLCLKPKHIKCIQHSGIFSLESACSRVCSYRFCIKWVLQRTAPIEIAKKTLDTLSGSQLKLLFWIYNVKLLASKCGRQGRREEKNMAQMETHVLWTAFRKNTPISWVSIWAGWEKTVIFFFICVMSCYIFYFVLFLSDTVLFYFILQVKALKTKNVHSMNLQFI